MGTKEKSLSLTVMAESFTEEDVSKTSICIVRQGLLTVIRNFRTDRNDDWHFRPVLSIHVPSVPPGTPDDLYRLLGKYFPLGKNGMLWASTVS